MRITSLKLSVLALVVIGALAMVPMASATSVSVLDISVNGTQIGTATLTQGGTGSCSAAATDVCVSITMTGSNAARIGGPTVGFSGNINQGGASMIINSNVSLPKLGVGACGSLGTTLCFDTTGPGTAGQWTFVLTNADVNSGIQMGLHVASSLCPTGNTCFATFTPGTPPPPTVPEPGTLGLLGTGLVGIAGLVRRRFLS